MSIISETSDAGVSSHVLPPDEKTPEGPIASYRPAIPQQYWDHVRPFVLDIMAEVEPLLSKDDGLQLMSVLTRFGLWVWQSAGLELTREVVFRNDLIEECFSRLFGKLSSNTVSTYRSRIRMVQRVLRERDNGDVGLNPRPFKGAGALPPYSEKELVSFRSWALGQNTHGKRRDAHLLLSLGAGAGLTTEDLVRLKTDDVLIDEEGVLLEVSGRRARKVPVLREWEALIVDAVQDLGPGWPLFGAQRTSYNNNAVSTFVARSTGRGPKPSLPRLRATWICYHLSHGTPIVHLRKASGTEGFEGFNRYLAFLEDPDLSDLRQTLRRSGDDQ